MLQDMASWSRDGIAGLQSVVLYSLPELDGAIDTVPLGGLVGDNIFLVSERVTRLSQRIKKWVHLRRSQTQVWHVLPLVPCPALPCLCVCCAAMLCPSPLCPAPLCSALPLCLLRVSALPCRTLPCSASVFAVLPCSALSCPALPCPASVFTALPCSALPCPALPLCLLPCPALHCLCVYCLALPCSALPCPACGHEQVPFTKGASHRISAIIRCGCMASHQHHQQFAYTIVVTYKIRRLPYCCMEAFSV